MKGNLKINQSKFKGSPAHTKLITNSVQRNGQNGLETKLESRKPKSCFKDQLQLYAESIVQQTCTQAKVIELGLKTQLDSLSSQMVDKCEMLYEAEQQLHARLDNEWLEIDCPSHETGLQKVQLKDRMEIFRTLLHTQEKVLVKLWNEWVLIQIELICVALQVFGEEALVMEESKVDTTAESFIKDAKKKYEEELLANDSAENAFSKAEQQLETLSSETIASLEAHFKSVKIGHNRRVEEFKKAVEAAGFG